MSSEQCSLGSILPPNYRHRAEAFARDLQQRLWNLGNRSSTPEDLKRNHPSYEKTCSSLYSVFTDVSPPKSPDSSEVTDPLSQRLVNRSDGLPIPYRNAPDSTRCSFSSDSQQSIYSTPPENFGLASCVKLNQSNFSSTDSTSDQKVNPSSAMDTCDLFSDVYNSTLYCDTKSNLNPKQQRDMSDDYCTRFINHEKFHAPDADEYKPEALSNACFNFADVKQRLVDILNNPKTETQDQNESINGDIRDAEKEEKAADCTECIAANEVEVDALSPSLNGYETSPLSRLGNSEDTTSQSHVNLSDKCLNELYLASVNRNDECSQLLEEERAVTNHDRCESPKSEVSTKNDEHDSPSSFEIPGSLKEGGFVVGKRTEPGGVSEFFMDNESSRNDSYSRDLEDDFFHQDEETIEEEETVENQKTDNLLGLKDDKTSESERAKLRRSSSLKTWKTPPDTPGRKKIVRFADVLGLDLADVRTFLDEIPKIPKSAFSDLQNIDMDLNYSKTSIENTQVSQYRSLVPLFQQPGGLADFFEKLKQRNVCLENSVVTDPALLAIAGTVRVRNVDYDKSVFIRYSLDGWKTYADLKALYVMNSCDGFSDQFRFILYAHTLEIGERIEFAVLFQSKGSQYWDNNGGINYIFQCVPAPPAPNSNLLSQSPSISDKYGSFY